LAYRLNRLCRYLHSARPVAKWPCRRRAPPCAAQTSVLRPPYLKGIGAAKAGFATIAFICTGLVLLGALQLPLDGAHTESRLSALRDSAGMVSTTKPEWKLLNVERFTTGLALRSTMRGRSRLRALSARHQPSNHVEPLCPLPI
jgi:hypothetical protein